MKTRSTIKTEFHRYEFAISEEPHRVVVTMVDGFEDRGPYPDAEETRRRRRLYLDDRKVFNRQFRSLLAAARGADRWRDVVLRAAEGTCEFFMTERPESVPYVLFAVRGPRDLTLDDEDEVWTLFGLVTSAYDDDERGFFMQIDGHREGDLLADLYRCHEGQPVRDYQDCAGEGRRLAPRWRAAGDVPSRVAVWSDNPAWAAAHRPGAAGAGSLLP